MNQRSTVVVFLAVMFLTWATYGGGTINIRTAKGGPVLLVVDDESVRAAAGAKPVLVIDGPNILTEKGGKRVFFIDGDILHTEPEGPVCAYIDGRHIKTKPGGAELFYINAKEIKTDHDGKILFYVDGDDMNRQQLMAALYTLRPDLIRRPADAGPGKPVAPAAPMAPTAPTAPAAPAAPAASTTTGAPKGFTGGTYSIYLHRSSDSKKQQGKFVFTKQGGIYVIDLKFTDGEPWQGVAVEQNGELWAAIGPVNTVGLAVYRNRGGGVLDGAWLNITGDPGKYGSEKLSGAPTIGGTYNITAAKAPFTGAPYSGTVDIEGLPLRVGAGEQPFVHLAWTLGAYKAQGVGCKSQNSLFAASSSGDDCAVVRFKIDPKTANLMGDYYSVGQAHGDYMLTKDAE